MTFLTSTFDLSSYAHHPEEALALALVLQEQLAARITTLALHTRQHPEEMARFVQLVEELLLDLRFCEDDVYPEEGLEAIDPFRDQIGGSDLQAEGGISLN